MRGVIFFAPRRYKVDNFVLTLHFESNSKQIKIKYHKLYAYTKATT